MKKPIILNSETKMQQLQSELDEIQSRSKTRTISAADVANILSEVERSLGISKKAMTGVTVFYSGAETFPRAYKYTPESTHFTAEYSGTSWRIVSIKRDACPNRTKNTEVVLTDEAKNAIIDAHSKLEIK